MTKITSDIQIRSQPYIGHYVSKCSQLKRQWIAYILAAVASLTTAVVWGFEADRDVTLGKSDSTVSVIVYGDLQVQSLDGVFSALDLVASTNTNMKNSSTGYVNSAQISGSEISITNLQSKWHFLVVLVDVKMNDGSGGTLKHINAITLPTAEIREQEYYEVGKHLKRRLLFRWSSTGEIVFEASSDSAADKLHITQVVINGLLRK